MAASTFPAYCDNSSPRRYSRSIATIAEESPDGARGTGPGFEQIIGISPALDATLTDARRVASTDSAVLLLGETGTGKELIARGVHNLSSRRDRPFVKLNCAAIPFNLLESELFGHEQGAFTGAVARRVGRFEMADTGTLFLDEIGDLPLAIQPKLLRVLQEQEFERLGSCRTQHVNVRLIAATHRDLAQMVSRNEFRSDLYYRLNVFPVLVPPLRERRADIPQLVRHFVDVFSGRMAKRIDRIPQATMDALGAYVWPGNVRELQNLIERAVIRSDDGVLTCPLPPSYLSRGAADTEDEERAANVTSTQQPGDSLEEVKRQHIVRVLERTGWVISGTEGAATILSLHPNTLRSLMERLGIRRGRRRLVEAVQPAA